MAPSKSVETTLYELWFGKKPKLSFLKVWDCDAYMKKFKEFQSEVENHHNKKIKFLWSDRGGKYLSYEFGLHLKPCGIVSQLTPRGTPQCNGVSVCRNRTLLDMMRSMMSLTDLPLSFWGYALETAAFT